MTRLMRVPVERIVVGERHRRDLGDIDGLAFSIAQGELLNPITIDPKRRLIAGLRRLRAWEQAKPGESIPALMVDSLGSALAALRAERDENEHRKAFTPSEAVALGEALEALERPKAKQRMSEGGKGGQVATPSRTRDTVGAATGLGGRTYEKAKQVVAAAKDTKAPAPVRKIAREAVAEMDRTGKVNGAYRKVVDAKVDHALDAEGVDASDLNRSKYRHRAAKVHRALRSDFLTLDPGRVVEVIDESDYDAWCQTRDDIAAWFDKFVRPKGLRAVNGGRS